MTAVAYILANAVLHPSKLQADIQIPCNLLLTVCAWPQESLALRRGLLSEIRPRRQRHVGLAACLHAPPISGPDHISHARLGLTAL